MISRDQRIKIRARISMLVIGVSPLIGSKMWRWSLRGRLSRAGLRHARRR